MGVSTFLIAGCRKNKPRWNIFYLRQGRRFIVSESNAMIEYGFPVIVLAPQGAMNDEMAVLVDKLRERHAEVIVISDVPEILSGARIPLKLPVSVPEWLSPLSTIVPGQLFATHLADARDYDVNAPRGLKKVTETV